MEFFCRASYRICHFLLWLSFDTGKFSRKFKLGLVKIQKESDFDMPIWSVYRSQGVGLQQFEDRRIEIVKEKFEINTA